MCGPLSTEFAWEIFLFEHASRGGFLSFSRRGLLDYASVNAGVGSRLGVRVR